MAISLETGRPQAKQGLEKKKKQLRVNVRSSISQAFQHLHKLKGCPTQLTHCVHTKLAPMGQNHMLGNTAGLSVTTEATSGSKANDMQTLGENTTALLCFDTSKAGRRSRGRRPPSSLA